MRKKTAWTGVVFSNEKTTPVIAEKDRNTVSLELMNRMKLHGMAAGLTETRWNGWPL